MHKRRQTRIFTDALFGYSSFRQNRTFRLYLILYMLMVLLPITFLLGYYYPSTRQIIIDNQYVTGKRDIAQIRVNMDSQLRNIYNLPNALFNQKNLRRYDLISNVFKRYTAKYELYNMIRTNTFIDEMFLYIQQIEQFIGPTGHGSFHISQIQKATSVYGMHLSDWDYEDMRTTLNTLTSNKIRVLKDIMIDGYKYSHAVCFLMPLTQNVYNYAVVLVFIGSDQLAQISGHLSKADEREILYFDEDGQLVYDTLNRSAEDIQSIYGTQPDETGFITLSDGQYFITSTVSEYFGWRYVSLLSYDSIMGDLKTLNSNSIALIAGVMITSVVLIWVSMQRTYRPIRTLSGLSNSVLKSLPYPGRGSRRDEMETVSAALVGLQQYSQQLSSSLNDARPMMRDYLTGSLLQNSAQDTAETARDLIRFGLYLTAPYRAAFVHYSSNDEREQAHGMLNELIDEDVQISAVRGQNARELCLLISGNADADRLHALLSSFLPYRQLALGEVVEDLADVSVSYRHAMEVMEELRLWDCVGKSMEYMNRETLSTRYPLELMAVLETALLHGDKNAVCEVVERIIALLTAENMQPNYVRNIYINTVSMIATALTQHASGATNIGLLRSADVLTQMTCPEMVTHLRAVTDEYSSFYSRQLNGLSRNIEMAVHHINEHLSDVSLSLLSVADYLEVSPSNLSRSFKAEMGKGFKEYVDQMRLEAAKQLLCDTQLSIECVASQIGYENASSFSRRFRAMCGVSPSEYRASKNG